jgi:hypothetical protein
MPPILGCKSTRLMEIDILLDKCKMHQTMSHIPEQGCTSEWSTHCRPIITIHGVSLEPAQLLDPFDLLLLPLLPVRHVPTAALRVTPHHLEPSIQVLHQPMRNASRNDDHIAAHNNLFDATCIVLMPKTQTRFAFRNAENLV